MIWHIHQSWRFQAKLEKMPYAMPQMLVALDMLLHKPKQIIIAGKNNDETAYRMLLEVSARYIPDKVLVQIDPAKAGGTITFASKVIQTSGETMAYVCENFACKLPVKTIDEFKKLIE